MYGYSKEELLTKSISYISAKTDVKKLSKKEGSRIFEATHIRKDGSTFPVEISSNIITIDRDSVILSVVRDISDREKAKEAIDESETKYKKMFENSPEAMLLVDNLGIIRNCNSAFYEISGRSENEIINKHFVKTNLLSVKKLPEYMKLWAKILREKKNQKLEFEWKDNNGEIRTSVGHFAPVIKKNKIAGFQALLKDITQQKEFEKNLILAKERAEENNRLKGAFLETMSHELRTPLNAVIGFSNLIEDENEYDSIKEMNKYVTENGKKLLCIIESIFDISMLETRSAVLKIEEFSVNDIFAELEITLKGMIELEHKSEISTLYQPGNRNQDIRITTDKQRLKQLLTNLLTNAVRYTDRGSIRYGYTLQKGDIQFFVSDTGIGIPQNKLQLIFQKFTQVDSSPTRSRGGLGLGLSIVDEISKLLNGELSVDSQYGKGSSFYFTLQSKNSGDTNKGKTRNDLSNKTIMVVEDVESNYLYLEKLLTEEGASVLWAQTGHDALAIVEKLDRIDLILMDIRMPDMDGYEITRKIKKMSPKIPVIAQTAYAMASDRKEAIDAGCSEHISKPIKVDILREIVHKYIHSRVTIPGIVL